MGLPVTFQNVLGEDSYSREGGIVFASGHVNLVLGRALSVAEHLAHDAERELTVDFLPEQQLRGQRVQPVPEATVRAMFMNNRAAEALAAGHNDQAYWWAREAVLTDPGFGPGLNTLGVIYLRSGRLDAAERTLRQALDRDPRRASTLMNLLRVAERSGRTEDARVLADRLAALQPHPPFEQLDRGREALAAGDYARARELFAAELRQQPFQPEAHFWMAVAQHGLGDERRAASHLEKAVEYSSTQSSHDLYAAKLDRLRAQAGARTAR
jgi:tetratricopeptide (TPR) repeat protein